MPGTRFPHCLQCTLCTRSIPPQTGFERNMRSTIRLSMFHLRLTRHLFSTTELIRLRLNHLVQTVICSRSDRSHVSGHTLLPSVNEHLRSHSSSYVHVASQCSAYLRHIPSHSTPPDCSLPDFGCNHQIMPHNRPVCNQADP